jgi:hypothetical protein
MRLGFPSVSIHGAALLGGTATPTPTPTPTVSPFAPNAQTQAIVNRFSTVGAAAMSAVSLPITAGRCGPSSARREARSIWLRPTKRAGWSTWPIPARTI